MKIIITEEQSEKLNRKIKLAVEKLGLVQARELFDKDIIKQAYIDNPLSYLDQFNNLKPVERGDDVYYVDNHGEVLFTYDKEDEQDANHGYYNINHDRIWKFFSEVMGCGYGKTQEIIRDWLSKTYNLKSLTPQWD